MDSPRAPEDDDDDFYTPKSPVRSRQPRRSQSADIYKKRAAMHSRWGWHSTPGGCQISYMCDQNSTYGLALHSRGCHWIGYMEPYRLSSTQRCFDHTPY
jgi:hypothetical protein